MLVEREKNLQTLTDSAKKAAEGRGNIVLLSGEAGIGKTALLTETRHKLESTHTILRGGCDPFHTPRPLGPIHDMAADLTPAISHLLENGQQSAQLYSMIYKMLETANRPVVLVIEDAHWADHATLDLLRFLGRRILFLKTTLVISFRDDEVDYTHPLSQALGELPHTSITRIALQPLSPEAVSQLASEAGGPTEGLHEITNGNPFFVTELLAGDGGNNKGIPASIRDAVGSRLNRLDKDEREFLQTISVIPGAITSQIIDLLYDSNGNELALACVQHNLLSFDPSGAYRFRHELARLSTQDRVSKREQKAVHAKILNALLDENADDRLDQLVHHAAGAGDAGRVLEFAPRAARRAAALGAHRESAAHLATALRFVGQADPETAAQLYESWAYEAGMALRIDEDVIEARRKAITLWRELNRPDKVGENLRALSRLHWYRGESVKASTYSDEAIEVLETLPPSSERAMAYSLRSQIHMLNDRMDEAIEWGGQALDLAKDFQNVEVKVHALNNMGTALLFRGQSEGRAMLQESLALSLEHGLHEDAARVYTNLSEYGVEFGNYKLAEQILAEGIRFSANHDVSSFTPYLIGRSAQLKLAQGYLRESETIAEGVLNSGRQQTLLMRLPALLVLSRARMRLGEPDAPALLQQAFNNAMATEELQYVIPARLSLIEAAWLDDKPEDGIAHIEALASLDPTKIHPWNTGELAIWTKRLGLSIPQGFTEDIPDPYRFEVSGNPTAAANLWDSVGAPYAAGITLTQVEGDGAKLALRRAVKKLESIEARAAAEKARRMAKALGYSRDMPSPRRGPYRAARKHPLGLTKREQEILRLLVSGATNAEISDTLSRSRRTIEHHVSSILKKLGVENRMEAMLRVHSEPWLAPEDQKTVRTKAS